MDLHLTSPANPRLKALVGLRRRRARDETGLTVVEGHEELSLALAAGVVPQTLYVCPELYSPAGYAGQQQIGHQGDLVAAARAAGAEIVTLSRAAFEKVAYREGPDGLLGVLPAVGSAQEQRMNALVNRGIRAKRRIASDLEPVADGVWLIRGGFPLKTMNVYLIEDEGQVTVFDAGIQTMTNAIAAAGARAGGIKRVVLGHGHADHRGVAPALGVPVLCHEDERADTEGDGGYHYFGSAKIFAQMGRAFADANLKLINK